MKKEDCLFYAQTNEGYIIKILFELLKQCTKSASFNITSESIYLCSMGMNRKLLIVLELFRINFSEYYCKEPINIGLNLSHIYKMIKSIKKKDSIIFYIKDDRFLTIKILPHENTRVIESNVNIHDIESIGYEIPDGYDKHPIIVPSSDYHKMCKDLNDIGKFIQITSGSNWIKFLCDAVSVYDRSVQFGNRTDKDRVVYDQKFQSTELLRLVKISGLCRNIQIYPVNDLPLKIVSKVGELGSISLYLKSMEQCDDEKEDMDSE